ncbi:kinase-like domain-containing protein, partial [Scheffersomyces amazonensis]|uniref:kinase-like domain-containing protein n=1 Tax=Scheffersomyces amazonensis TaxID=1078765 RepID=UPI00315D9E34
MRRSIDKVGTLLDPLDDAQFNNTGLVAIKTFRYRMKKLKYFKNIKEVDFILNMPSHPCLLQIYEMIIDDYNFELHVCMESMTQNLNILMRNRNYKFTRSTVKCILSQLLSAINHIHIHGYYHRDIKPDNILIIPTCYYYGSNEGIPPHRQNDVLVVKLGDYGLARSIYDTKISTGYVSTRWYRAPEILLYQGFYSQPVDIWAFGVIALELVNHAPLIAGGSHYDQVLKTIQILGSPLPEYFHPHFHRPLGGFWREAANLAEKCQFQFPLCYGSTYTEIIKERYYDEIIPVASVCLLWDPYARASSEALCGMTY